MDMKLGSYNLNNRLPNDDGGTMLPEHLAEIDVKGREDDDKLTSRGARSIHGISSAILKNGVGAKQYSKSLMAVQI